MLEKLFGSKKNGSYSGETRDDEEHGFGKLVFDDGSNYEGRFLFGEFHGEGKFMFSDGGYAKGQWIQNYFVKGEFSYGGGNKHEGEFKTVFTKDKFAILKHGKGKYYDYEIDTWFTGFWKDDEFDQSIDDWDSGDL